MLIAIHGFTETDESWRSLLAPLAQDLRCPLLPGHGWRPCARGETLTGTAEAMAALLPEVGGDLMGYSMGGRVALQTALDHPARIRRLVLVSCRPGLADPAHRRERSQRDEGHAEILEQDGMGPFIAWWESQPVLRHFRPLAPSQMEDLRARRLNHDPLGLAAALRGLGQGGMADLRPRLKELSMPVLLVAGAEDRSFLADMQAMAAAIPRATLAVIPGCGHAVHREATSEFLSLLAGFLR